MNYYTHHNKLFSLLMFFVLLNGFTITTLKADETTDKKTSKLPWAELLASADRIYNQELEVLHGKTFEEKIKIIEDAYRKEAASTWEKVKEIDTLSLSGEHDDAREMAKEYRYKICFMTPFSLRSYFLQEYSRNTNWIIGHLASERWQLSYDLRYFHWEPFPWTVAKYPVGEDLERLGWGDTKVAGHHALKDEQSKWHDIRVPFNTIPNYVDSPGMDKKTLSSECHEFLKQLKEPARSYYLSEACYYTAFKYGNLEEAWELAKQIEDKESYQTAIEYILPLMVKKREYKEALKLINDRPNPFYRARAYIAAGSFSDFNRENWEKTSYTMNKGLVTRGYIIAQKLPSTALKGNIYFMLLDKYKGDTAQFRGKFCDKTRIEVYPKGEAPLEDLIKLCGELEDEKEVHGVLSVVLAYKWHMKEDRQRVTELLNRDRFYIPRLAEAKAMGSRFYEVQVTLEYISFLYRSCCTERMHRLLDDLNATLEECKYTSQLFHVADMNFCHHRIEDGIRLMNLITVDGYHDDGYEEFVTAFLLMDDIQTAQKLANEIRDDSRKKKMLETVQKYREAKQKASQE